MKNLAPFLAWILLAISSCNNKIYTGNGETIYRTGKNLQGERLLDKKASIIRIVNSCQTCHGKSGDRMNSISIRFTYLSDPRNFNVPYTDSLFYRFLDRDIKSDGTKSNIGVRWKMSDKDKKDLLHYLKSL